MTQRPLGVATAPAGAVEGQATMPVNRSIRDFRNRAAESGVGIPTRVASGGLEVHLDAYDVRLDGRELELSPRQVELLALFLAAPGRVWSREQLHWVCWADVSPSRRVDVQLCRIRAKLGAPLFRNIRDRGWSLRPLPAAA